MTNTRPVPDGYSLDPIGGDVNDNPALIGEFWCTRCAVRVPGYPTSIQAHDRFHEAISAVLRTAVGN